MTESQADDRLISGRAVARKIESGAAEGAAVLQARGIQPTLAVVHFGDHPDAASYRRAIDNSARRSGVSLRTIAVPTNEAGAGLLQAITQLNGDSAVHGVILQNPMPFAFRQLIGNQLLAEKDVEGLTALNLGRLALDEPAVVPCTPAAVLALIEDRVPDIRGRRVVVVNGSPTIGRPLVQILIAREATVVVCGIATPDLAAETRRADILVVAIGAPRALGPEHIGQGALVIDVGINEDPAGGMCGDVDTEAVLDKVAGITPVPGGVGPVTTAMLMANTVLLAERHGVALLPAQV
jgi:methylenetetrahydrofolate dehydrogenase (NADP+) / methenyltetrahydrofolate cyclohydrolase